MASSTVSAAPARTAAFSVRAVQLARAAFAALAAVMITFSSDHSAPLGLSVFNGFVIATALVWGVSAWAVYPSGRRWPAVLLAVLGLLAGAAGSIMAEDRTAVFFIVVTCWALLSGAVELVWGLRERRTRPAGMDAGEPRDQITVGAITVLLGLVMPFIPMRYALDYVVEDKGNVLALTLTGITIAVGVFGGFAAIVAVYLGIAGFSPRRPVVAPAVAAAAADEDGEPLREDTEAGTGDGGTGARE